MKTSIKILGVYLVILVFLTLFLIYVTDRYILTLDFYEQSGDPVAGISGQQAQIFKGLRQWIYFSSAIYLIIKLCLIALILNTALYLSGHQVRFVGVMQVTVCAEFIFLIPAAAKIIFFHIYYPHGTLFDWHSFYILSALSVFGSAPADWFYALQTLNAFEVAYWFALAYGLSRITGLTFDRSLRLVISSYLPALLIWIAAVTFFTLMMFPATAEAVFINSSI